jgi:NADPH:quinone reductase-like Zn-dependent oxidoreductase
MAVSTDYRDSRKSAYQQYAVVPDFNACKIPSNVSVKEAAPLGVAFVAAALGLGICMGMDFIVAKGGPRGPNLLRIIRALSRDALPQDIRAECFDGIEQSQGAKSGDWIAIWGGKSPLGQLQQEYTKETRLICFRLYRYTACQTGWIKSYSYR